MLISNVCEAGQPAAPEAARQRAEAILSEWRGRGLIAVFGAGAHTRKILPVLERRAELLAGIADDSPACWDRQCGRWTIGAPRTIIDDRVTGILVSSDVQQIPMSERVRSEFGQRCAILTLYVNPEEDHEGPHLPSSGERQTGRTIEEIELGHRARYYWALQHLPAESIILDAACGNGYGSRILADGGNRVLGIDISPEAVAFARHHFAGANTTYRVGAVDQPGVLRWRVEGTAPFDAVVSFETIEHLDHPEVFLREVFESLRPGGNLFCSTPNPEAMSIEEAPYHRRHYSGLQMVELIGKAGFHNREWYGQEGLQILKGRSTDEQRYILYHAVRPA